MNDPSSLPERPQADPAARGGIDIQGGDVRAGRDIVAGDVNVAGDSISGQTVSVQRGYSANDVQRLILIVGALVFATAACFFIFGAVSAAALVGAINQPLKNGSSQQAAFEMQQKIEALNSLQSGQRFRVNFSEDEVSSYFRFLLGPAIGVSDGRARFTNTPGVIAIGGYADRAGGLPFLAEVKITTDPTAFQVQSVWLKVLPTPEDSSIGWIPVTPFAQDLGTRINSFLFGRVRFSEVSQINGTGDQPNQLLLLGVAK